MAHLNLITEESFSTDNPSECSDSSYRVSELLPFVLIIEIILRLPVKSIIRFKSVCKTWCDLISEPYFTKAYLKNPQFDANVVVHTHTLDEKTKQHMDLFYFVEIGINGEKVMRKPFNPKSHDDFRSDNTSMYRALVGSHNGLLCLVETLLLCDEQKEIYYNSYNGHRCRLTLRRYKGQIVWIINPLIGEYMKLPKVQEYDAHIHFYDNPSYGFGSSICNDQYKVIRIGRTYRTYGLKLEYKVDAKILTVGVDDQWRDIEDSSLLHNILHQHGINLNGFLHWVVPSGYICAFDIGKEKVHLMSLPCVLRVDIYLGNLDGRLCFIDNISPLVVYIWTMKQYGVESSWTMDFTLRSFINCFHPLNAITTMRNGNLLMSRSYCQNLFSFDLETYECVEYEGSDLNGKSYLFSYVPSFVSLTTYFKKTPMLMKFQTACSKS